MTLNDNQLSGSISITLDDLTELRRPYLHSDQLSGPIPSELGNLKNLNGMDLSGNQFSSSIPITLGDLTKLKRLYLQFNQLSSPIRDVVLSYHELEGPILDNKAFTNASLEGNKGLCGNLTGFQPCERPSSHLIGKRRKLILIILLPVMGVLVLLCAFLGVLFMCDKRRRAKDVERWNDDSWLSISMLYGKALYRDILNATEEFDATF
ncbi:hypothetical protein T459_11934 [Capsicum annuum]|uniref:Uncharacterized protein n=1 Tax=Capsicum annuum TaxID=4072 RepID=A0A2G2ZNG7_CAPAN|nr:hypothetical protein T459_11934 [Capsicum annuum]